MTAAGVDVMPDKRRYERFKLNNREVNGKMILATEVKVIDISISGISLKANRRFNIGSDYTLKLEGKRTVFLRCTVVWCSLTETRKGSKEEMIPIYSAGMQFKDMSTERVSELQYFIESHKIEEVHVIGGTRLNIRFHIKDPENAVLIYPDNYVVKTISLGGMLIECMQSFEIESRIPMEMFIHEDNPLKFVGRVASCRVIDKEDQKQYDIGIEFLDLTEKDREVLASFIAFAQQ
jgi:c-di-GMP-binding flagellar brake protein YcgR